MMIKEYDFFCPIADSKVTIYESVLERQGISNMFIPPQHDYDCSEFAKGCPHRFTEECRLKSLNM